MSVCDRDREIPIYIQQLVLTDLSMKEDSVHMRRGLIHLLSLSGQDAQSTHFANHTVNLVRRLEKSQRHSGHHLSQDDRA